MKKPALDRNMGSSSGGTCKEPTEVLMLLSRYGGGSLLKFSSDWFHFSIKKEVWPAAEHRTDDEVKVK